MLIYGVCLVASIIAALHDGGLHDLSIAFAFGLLLLAEWPTRPQRMLSIYGAGHAHTFEFIRDEAMVTLRLVTQVAQRPMEFLEKIRSRDVPPGYAVDPPERPKFMRVVLSKFQNTSANKLLVAIAALPKVGFLFLSLFRSCQEQGDYSEINN